MKYIFMFVSVLSIMAIYKTVVLEKSANDLIAEIENSKISIERLQEVVQELRDKEDYISTDISTRLTEWRWYKNLEKFYKFSSIIESRTEYKVFIYWWLFTRELKEREVAFAKRSDIDKYVRWQTKEEYEVIICNVVDMGIWDRYFNDIRDLVISQYGIENCHVDSTGKKKQIFEDAINKIILEINS